MLINQFHKEMQSMFKIYLQIKFDTVTRIGTLFLLLNLIMYKYEGHLESKERFAIQRYLLIIGKKKNMQVL